MSERADPPLDLSTIEGAVRARKKPVSVEVTIAEQAGAVITMEGPVQHLAGDAIVTGGLGERWPVARERFLAAYEPADAGVDPAAPPGSSGRWRKRPIAVLAWRLDAPRRVAVGHAADPLLGRPGDWLVQYGRDDTGMLDQGVVAPEVFEATYEILGEERAAAR